MSALFRPVFFSFAFLLIILTPGQAQLFNLLNARVQSPKPLLPVQPTLVKTPQSHPSSFLTSGDSLQTSATSRLAFLARLQQPKLEQKERWTPLPNKHSELLSVSGAANGVTTPTSSSGPTTTTPLTSAEAASSVKLADGSTSTESNRISRQPKTSSDVEKKDEIKLYNLNAIASNTQQQFHIGYIKASDLQKVIASGFQLRELRGRLEPEQSASSQSETLQASADDNNVGGKTSPRKTPDRLRLARLQAETDSELVLITQKDISNQPIVKEDSKQFAGRKNQVSPKQAHFGQREKKQRLVQQPNAGDGLPTTSAATLADVKGSSAQTKDASDLTKGKSGIKGGKSRKSVSTKNLVAARTVPFSANLLASSVGPLNESLDENTSADGINNHSSSDIPTSSLTTTITTPNPGTLSSSLPPVDFNGSFSNDKTPNTDTEVSARTGKLQLLAGVEEDDEDDSNNSLAAIAQHLNHNFGGFGFRNTALVNGSVTNVGTSSNTEQPSIETKARLHNESVSQTKGGQLKTRIASNVKGKPEIGVALKSPLAARKTAPAVSKSKPRPEVGSGKTSRKRPEAFSISNVAPATSSSTTVLPSATTTPISWIRGGNSASTFSPSRIESETEPSSEENRPDEESNDPNEEQEFTFINNAAGSRLQELQLLQRRQRHKQNESARAGPHHKSTSDDYSDADYEGFDELNEVELIDAHNGALLAMHHNSVLLTAACCSCSPLHTLSSSTSVKPQSISALAKHLRAQSLFRKLPDAEKLLQELLQQHSSNAEFTLFLPSHEAVDRLPRTLITRLNQRPAELRLVLANHLMSGRRTLAQLLQQSAMTTFATRGQQKSLLRFNFYRNQTFTVNGQRLVSADQAVQEQNRLGLIHLLDGLLFPLANKNLLETLKACNKFDGFVTLAQGTGLSDILEQGE